MKTTNLESRRGAAAIICLISGMVFSAGFGCGLKLQRINTSVQRPSNIAVYFSVETHSGEPVAGLDAKQFRIYEDDQLISPYESKQTILNPDVAVSHSILLLLDLSGSIVKSGSLPALINAANTFADQMAKKSKVKVAVYGFDGRKRLISVVGFTTDTASVKSGLERLRNHKVKDPSTNLNGAVVLSVKKLEKQMKKMHERLDKSSVAVFVIGLGVDIDSGQLSKIGRDGFVKATNKGTIDKAFTQVAQRIEAQGRKFYLLSYCSPSRAGEHLLRVKVTYKGKSGSIEHKFNAKGFRPGCNPKRKPNFSLRRVRLKRK